MIKEWLFRTFFQKQFQAALKAGSMDAFHKAHADIMETMRDDLDTKADELAQEKLSKLLSVVDPRMIVRFSPKERAIYIGGERADEARLTNLKAEAEAITSMEIWKLIYETPKELAQIALFKDDGDSKVVHTKGRAVLYTLDTQDRIIKTLSSYQQPSK